MREPSDPNGTMTEAPAEPAATPPTPAGSPEAPRERDERVETLAQYELWDEIAQGGLGRILRAWDRHLGREVAVKVPRGGGDHGRFAREAMITAQLEHPAIVPVHAAGKLADGRPFYVMKLLAGKPLREAIAAAGTLAERMALLPTVIAVCDAVAYAHSRRVIHRDLKPSNVLVGAFGETAVVDWGMAKKLDEADLHDAGDVVVAFPEDTHTQVGTVLGTPAYMPPEQARGEPVDERADVYALGAMLYQLITGDAPYRRGTAKEIVQAVLAGPPARIEALQPQVPPEIAAIARKAMARRAEDRYPSARELADDLRRYQTGRLVAAHVYTLGALVRRWLRRYRGPVAVAAVAAAVLAVVGTLAVRRIVAEKTHADEQRSAAEELVDFMLVDLRDRMRQVGKLDLLEGVAGKVDTYYRKLQAELDPEALRRRSQAFSVLGAVRNSQGNARAAREAQSESVAIARRLAALRPDREDDLQTLSAAIVDLAITEMNLRRSDESKARYDEALAVIDGRSRLAQDSPGWRQERAHLLTSLADLLVLRGENDRSIEALREAIALQELLGRAGPRSRSLAADSVVSQSRLAVRLSTRSRHEEALAHATIADALAESYAVEHPRDVDWQSTWASAKAQTADVYVRIGRFADAAAWLLRAREIRIRLAARDPDNFTWQFAVADSDWNLAQARNLAGQVDAALQDAKEAIAILERLVAAEPAKLLWSVRLALAYSLGAAIERDRAPEHAVGWLESARLLGERLVARDPKSGYIKGNLGATLVTLAEIQVKLGREAEAIANVERAIAIFDEALKLQPADRTSAHNLADSHTVIADIDARAGRTAKAVEHLAVAIRLGEDLVKQNPDFTPEKLDLARRFVQMADLMKAGDAEGGRARLARARAILKELQAAGRLPAELDRELREVLAQKER